MEYSGSAHAIPAGMQSWATASTIHIQINIK